MSQRGCNCNTGYPRSYVGPCPVHHSEQLETVRTTRTEYRIACEWVDERVTFSAPIFTLDEAKAMLKSNAKTFKTALRGGWIESRQITEWEKA